VDGKTGNTRDVPIATRALAADLRAARKKRQLSVPMAAHQIGISASALRRIEKGETFNPRGMTLLLVLDWAARRGYTEFAGFGLTLRLPTAPEQLALIAAEEAQVA